MKKLKKIWNIFTTVFVVLFVLMAVFLMGSRLMGYKVFTVLSGSMEPEYKVGDLIYVEEVPPETVKIGDPITFVMNEELVVATHRVVRIDTESRHFYTKGDANEAIDAPTVHFNNLIGIPRFAIPKLGYVSNFIQNPPGTYITIGIVVILVAFAFLPDFTKGKKKEEEPSEETTSNNEE